MTNQEIAQQWLDNCCSTIQQYDHGAHMNLISKDIQVFGIPGFEVINYDDWYSQCEYEFQEKLIAEASYSGLKVRSANDEQIMFLTTETIRATDGTVDSHPIEVVLKKEPDGQWRVVQERLLDSDEAKHYGLS
jgi:ketosteroid isomerase-like protein